MRRGEVTTVAPTVADVWALLEAVCDPEIPVVSLRELGVLRTVTALTPTADATPAFDITITPTYSGCPAMGQMEDDLVAALRAAGIHAQVTTLLAPAWTTDWMTDSAHAKLLAYGIAPPGPAHGSATGAATEIGVNSGEKVVRFSKNKIAKYSYTACREGGVDATYSLPTVPCTRCASDNTTETSHFGSTACKALYKCLDCWEPFDYFKPL
jgi:ring-1,2-phenylacetyl-CoA epoxidase subunit PaaD